MKKIKKPVLIGIILFGLGMVSVSAFAVSKYNSPAEITANLTNRTVESVLEERTNTGKTYGEIAKDAGSLDEFKEQNLQRKKDIINQRVKDGTMTKEQAEEAIRCIEENQANCDGTGAGQCGLSSGQGQCFGQGQGLGKGRGMGCGRIQQ